MPTADTPATTRRARPTDLPDLLLLAEEFCAVDHHEYDKQRITMALVPMLDGDTLGQVWVLDDGHQLGGYAIVTWSWSLESGGRDCILDEIYVRDPGAGLGSVLIERAIDEAEAYGARALFLETESHNARARRFYERHGLAVEDSVWMSMRLPRHNGANRGAAQGPTRRHRSWRCALGFHAWEVAHNDGGERYDICRRCGAASEWTPTGTGWTSSA